MTTGDAQQIQLDDAEERLPAPPATEPTEERRVFVAGMWRRIGAAIVDLLCLAPALLASGWIVLRIAGEQTPVGQLLRPEALLELFLGGDATVIGAVALAVVCGMLYAFLFISLTGSTLGLRLWRVRVINVYGGRPEWWRVFVRCWGFVIGLFAFGLGLLWIGFDREKRGLHDWLAGTYVIRNGQRA